MTPPSGTWRPRPFEAAGPGAPGQARYGAGCRCEACRVFCDPCYVVHRRRQERAFIQAGPAALARMRAEGRDPMADREARRKLGASQAGRIAADRAWSEAHPERLDPEVFRREILPLLQGVPLRRMVEATGLSLRHCSRIRRGEVVPHPRHWDGLRLISQSEPMNCTRSTRLQDGETCVATL